MEYSDIKNRLYREYRDLEGEIRLLNKKMELLDEIRKDIALVMNNVKLKTSSNK
jgi:uncharacterized protein YeeX (DUF496 family)